MVLIYFHIQITDKETKPGKWILYSSQDKPFDFNLFAFVYKGFVTNHTLMRMLLYSFMQKRRSCFDCSHMDVYSSNVHKINPLRISKKTIGKWLCWRCEVGNMCSQMKFECFVGVWMCVYIWTHKQFVHFHFHFNACFELIGVLHMMWMRGKLEESFARAISFLNNGLFITTANNSNLPPNV